MQNASLTELGRRLATTQLLRDGVYRLCEAYANGAISSQEYALVLSRYGDTMVTLLAIEAVTGVADKLVSASAAASASAPPAVAPPAQKPQASNGTPDAKPTVNNAALRLHGHAGNTVDNAFDASFKRIAYAFLRDPLPMSVKAAAKPAAANGAGDQANSPDPASGAAPAGENADVVTAADAVVRLQENYLKQSAYAPLIVLCTQSLSGQLPDDSKNSIATNCTSVLASFVTIQSKKLQDEATRVTANQPNRPNQPVQKPPAHKPVKP
ncbi:hypothetical protein CBA19CS11_30935 [Caballeronia novacaledonica]|uniref:hypothetical protein n=1 Tax=Caballeronia novacaledonica TaxID=1544861 RepID=UPI001EE27F13|nr:hypothetical protein [Caballeronia novacaledonica]GJH13347.1 hypothetical protein CBA19CS11_30935 [Caballeronia novacaledonica]